MKDLLTTPIPAMAAAPMPRFPKGVGPVGARIMIVGECYGWEDARAREPLSGESGKELNRMLHEVGIMRSACYVTNLLNSQPDKCGWDNMVPSKKKDVGANYVPLFGRMVHPWIKQGYISLLQEIEFIKPNIIITCGAFPLWALTGAWSAHKWRGSTLMMQKPDDLLLAEAHTHYAKVLPIISPGSILAQWDWRAPTLRDLGRAADQQHYPEIRKPAWNFIIRPSFPKVMETLEMLTARVAAGSTHLSLDLETRAGHIACCGIAWSRLEAICIPFMTTASIDGYWSLEEHTAIVYKLYKLFTHPNCKVSWQNGLYDAQYIYRHWHFVPNGFHDTMIGHHAIFPGTQKSLDYLASLYCEYYCYWKDDGKTWAKTVREDQLWAYNCEDCVYTFEIVEVELAMVERFHMHEVHDFQQKMFYPVLQAMQRGARIDQNRRQKFAGELHTELAAREAYFQYVLGHPLNPRSPPQMTKLFYEDLKQKPVMSRATKKAPAHVTCDDAALITIAGREPLLRPLIRAIQEYRSLGVFLSTFVLAELDVDQRMRCSYNIAGTETFRFSSSENAFGSGTNLQNVPSGGDMGADLTLPNVRKLFVPDVGFELFDTDLSKADLRVVAWEADEREMKAMLAAGGDPYIEAAREFYRDPTIKKTKSDGSPDPRYKEFKAFAHGTHYLQTHQGLAARNGMLVQEAYKLQQWYFGKYPRIPKWQAEFKKKVAANHYVENKFGNRQYIFSRITDDTFREAIAWVPQSTVALYINRIWLNLHNRFPHIMVLLQVHDSLVGQYPLHRRDECLAQLAEASQVIVPYDDPLIIPVGVKTSATSWGDCE